MTSTRQNVSRSGTVISWVCPPRLWLLLSIVGLTGIGCNRYREDLDYSYAVEQVWPVDDLNHGEIVQFESVFWEPDDTVSLRRMIVDDGVASGRDVLEIGTGTGLIAILCLQYDATSVIATDINPAAVANAQYNAAMLVPNETLEVRQVPIENPAAFAVIRPEERFDLIVSNPPWEDGEISEPADHAFYDPEFVLQDSLLDGLAKHLKPGGRCLLAYGQVAAIRRLQREAGQRGFEWKILDDRDLDSLDPDFLPGMLIEIRVPIRASGQVQADSTATVP
jgi:tRNA1(Val) A37 N6-methylase TrmN6